ncbi:MAG: class I SAM-dependent methyltransferase [Chloroflexota bacterium]
MPVRFPLEYGVIDIAFCQLSLIFIPDKEAALKEMQRVLRLAGRLAVMVGGDRHASWSNGHGKNV